MINFDFVSWVFFRLRTSVFLQNFTFWLFSHLNMDLTQIVFSLKHDQINNATSTSYLAMWLAFSTFSHKEARASETVLQVWRKALVFSDVETSLSSLSWLAQHLYIPPNFHLKLFLWQFWCLCPRTWRCIRHRLCIGVISINGVPFLEGS